MSIFKKRSRMPSVPGEVNDDAIADEKVPRAPDPDPDPDASDVCNWDAINEYIRRCLAVEFHDDEEVRTFRGEPDFSRVLEPLNSGQFEEAIREGNNLVPKYPDFDLIYKWLGSAYRQNGQLDEAAEVLLRGLAKSKRKALLLTDLGDTEWQRHDVAGALYWLAQAIHCANPLADMAYLLAGYIAVGRGMEGARDALFERADSLNPGSPLRLSHEVSTRLISEQPSLGDTVGIHKVLDSLSSSPT